MPRARAMLDPPGPRTEAVWVVVAGLAAIAILLVSAARAAWPSRTEGEES